MPLNGQNIVSIGIGPVSRSGSRHIPFKRRISTDAVLVSLTRKVNLSRSPGLLPRPFLNSTTGKCTKESESYTSPFARTVHSTFSASVAGALRSKARRANVAAVATQVPKALPIISHSPVADMAAQRKQVLTLDERESRAQAFFEGLTNPDRLADAMAGLTPEAWVNDVIANMEDPTADAPR